MGTAGTVTLRERHVDRLLAEELEASPEFAAWFTRRVFGDMASAELPASCVAVVGHYRQAGETDVFLTMQWESGSHGAIHIENKIAARPQEDQAVRYVRAVDLAAADLNGCALVAPRAWMSRHPNEASLYGGRVSYEDIAEYLAARANALDKEASVTSRELATRLRYRVGLLTGAVQRRIVRDAIEAHELTDWNAAAAQVIAAVNGLSLGVVTRQRSSYRAKSGRFFQFSEALTEHPSYPRLRLQLKVGDSKSPARVSIDIRDAGDDDALRRCAHGAGFEVTSTIGGTLVVSATSLTLQSVKLSEPVSEQIAALEEAAALAQRLVEWWERQGCRPIP